MKLLLNYAKNSKMKIEEITQAYIDMTPELQHEQRKVRENQINLYDILQKHENFDEIKHLELDINFDELFIEFM